MTDIKGTTWILVEYKESCKADHKSVLEREKRNYTGVVHWAII